MGRGGVMESSSRREPGFPSGRCRRSHPLKQCSVQEFPEPRAMPPYCLEQCASALPSLSAGPENPDLPPLKLPIVMLRDLCVQRAPSQPLLMPRSSATAGTPRRRAPAPDASSTLQRQTGQVTQGDVTQLLLPLLFPSNSCVYVVQDRKAAFLTQKQPSEQTETSAL